MSESLPPTGAGAGESAPVPADADAPRAVGRWHVRITVLLTVYLVYEASSPGFSRPAMMCWLIPIVPLLMLVLPVTYVVRLIRYRTACRRLRAEGREPAAEHIRRWWVLPICALVLLTVVTLDWPLRLAFAVSRPSLEAVADLTLEGHRTHRKRQWIDLVRVEEIQDDDRSVRFITGYVFLESVGLLYDPSGVSPRSRYGQPLAPGWYRVSFGN